MIEELREKAGRLPQLPGVYIMLDSAGEVVYVGKAKLLKNRVSSYFHGEHEPKTSAMVSKVSDFDVIVAASEFEALVLENSLIKRHQPRYNILLRDDKGYPFVRLDIKSEYPRFSLVSKTTTDGAKYFGPFGGRSLTKDIIDTICKALLLPTCERKFPRDIGKQRPCLNFHMGTCLGYCMKDRSTEEYRNAIRLAEMILDGKTKQLKSELEEKMIKAAEDLRFEIAAEIRDKISAITNLEKRQRVIAAVYADTDAVGFYRGAKSCFSVLHYTEGELSGKDYDLMDEPLESDCEAVSGFLGQYYLSRGAWPKTILLPCDIEDREALEKMISESAGRKVAIETPKRGDSVKLVGSATVNAREESLRATTLAERRLKTLEWLQKTLDLKQLPERIEAFDVSNIGSFGLVAAMTVFVRGRPQKRDYRKFKIKTVEGQDDYHSMKEAVSRRFNRMAEGDEKFSNHPDLLLIDGGGAHASAAREAVNSFGMDLPVFGMVKDDRHRTRALVSPEGKEIGLSGNPAVFAFIGNIQEETHRFAIEYHRSLRSAGIGTSLDRIPGVGEKRRNELLMTFKTIKAIKEASLEELCRAVPKNTAKAVHDFFHAGKREDVK